MTQYLLSVHYVEGEGASQAAVDSDPDALAQIFEDVDKLNRQMQDAGVWVFAGGLEEPHVATVVQERDGEILTTDGPFPEAKEQLGGVWILDVADQQAALDWARRATRACRGPVEVRPFQSEPEE